MRINDKIKYDTINDYLYARYINATYTPLMYVGLIVGSGLDVFDANTAYYAEKLYISASGGASISAGTVNFYDEGNVLFFQSNNNAILFDNLEPVEYNPNPVIIENIIFARVAGLLYTHVRFVGLQINIP